MTAGYIHSKTSGYHASFTFSDFQSGCVGYAQKGFALGAEIYPNATDGSIWAQKAGVHLMGMGLCLGFSAVNFTNSEQSDFRIMPEIGIDILTYANATYGFVPHMAGSKINSLSPHRITFSLYLRKSIKEYGPGSYLTVPKPILEPTSTE